MQTVSDKNKKKEKYFNTCMLSAENFTNLLHRIFSFPLLTITTLWANSADDKTDYIFFSFGDNLYEMSNPVYRKKKIVQYSSAVNFTQHAKH